MTDRAGAVVGVVGRTDYEPTWRAMQAFTAVRADDTPDEIWLTEHPPVYTLGLAGRREHLRRDAGIPVIKVDRGGQITLSRAGADVVAYLLVDLRRARLGVRDMVRSIEAAVVEFLDSQGISAYGRPDAPGVYVRRGDVESKIAALGLKVRNGCTYHGLALNVAMDLAPFGDIDPCGFPGLAVTQLADFGVNLDAEVAAIRATPRQITQPGRVRSWFNPLPITVPFTWRLMDAVNLEEDAIRNDLTYTMRNKDALLFNFYVKGKTGMQKAMSEAPYAFVIPANGGDNADVTDLINNLHGSQHIEVDRAGAAFTADGRQFAAGDYVVRMNQPYGLTAKELFPFAPGTELQGEKKEAGGNNAKEAPKPAPAAKVVIDLPGIQDRVFEVPLPAGVYSGLAVGEKALFFVDQGSRAAGEPKLQVKRAYSRLQDIKTKRL